MDLDYTAQGPVHRWNVIFSENDDGAFSYVVIALVPFVSDVQFVQILPMPAAPEMLLEFLNMLPAGETIGWSVPEISFSNAG